MNDTVGIVGGGLAGLTCSYYLVKNGYNVVIYEGNNRLGGRVYSGKFPNGQIYENGGELIDSTHKDLLHLIKELNLKVNDELKPLENNPTEEELIYVTDYPDDEPDKHNIHKVIYLTSEAANDYFNKVNPSTNLSIFQQIYYDAKHIHPQNFIQGKTEWPLIYDNAYYNVDKKSLEEYINNLTSFLRKDKNGSKTKLAQLFNQAFLTECGAEINKLSPVNLLKLLDFNTEKTYKPLNYKAGQVPVELFSLFGDSDERFHTKNGNYSIIKKLKKYLCNSNKCKIKMGYCLTKIKHCSGSLSFDKYGNKPYRVWFKRSDDSCFSYMHNHIVIAIPFSTIRKCHLSPEKFVDIEESNFSELKKYAIQHLPMGKNSKLNIQFLTKFWKKNSSNGFIFANNNDYWDVSRDQNHETGILVEFKGGENCNTSVTNEFIEDDYMHNLEIKRETDVCLDVLQDIFPETKKHFKYTHDPETKKITNVAGYCWHHSPWAKGSYAYWGPGQYNGYKNCVTEKDKSTDKISFAGYEGVPEPYNKEQTGNCHFAGEHTSFMFQGYMNGAVESGIRVANEIIQLTK